MRRTTYRHAVTQSQRCHVTRNCVGFGFLDFQAKGEGLAQ